MAEAIAAISVVVVAVAFVWAVGVGPFGDDGQSVKSVESLVAAKEGGSSASCRWLGQGEAYGELQNVYRCQVRGSKTSPSAPACYWIRQVKVTKITKPRAEYAC